RRGERQRRRAKTDSCHGPILATGRLILAGPSAGHGRGAAFLAGLGVILANARFAGGGESALLAGARTGSAFGELVQRATSPFSLTASTARWAAEYPRRGRGTGMARELAGP